MLTGFRDEFDTVVLVDLPPALLIQFLSCLGHAFSLLSDDLRLDFIQLEAHHLQLLPLTGSFQTFLSHLSRLLKDGDFGIEDSLPNLVLVHMFLCLNRLPPLLEQLLLLLHCQQLALQPFIVFLLHFPDFLRFLTRQVNFPNHLLLDSLQFFDTVHDCLSICLEFSLLACLQGPCFSEVATKL